MPGCRRSFLSRTCELDMFRLSRQRSPQNSNAEIATMMEGFTKETLHVNSVDIVLRHGGSGPPLLLMHGNPFTHLSWNRVAPELARRFTVVTPDLRGYGDSSKPDGGKDHYAYSFREMGKDMVEVMGKLGFDAFFAAGHDRGAR